MPAKHPPSSSKLTRKFTEKRFEKICGEIANSDKGLASICQKFGIAACTFYSWLKVDPKLQEQYTEAREQQAEFMADQVIEIANDDSKDMITDPITRQQTPNRVSVERSRLRMEAYKWRIAVLSPKKYSNKKIIEVPVVTEPIIIDWTPNGYKNAEKEDLKIQGTTFEELIKMKR